MSLNEIIKEPTTITCFTSSFLNHILTNSSEKMFQKEVIDVRILDHQLKNCTKKIKRIKHSIYNQIQVRYNVEIFNNALKTVQFPNCNIFSNVKVAYSDLLNKISDAINHVAPIQEMRVKNNT